MGEHVSSLGHFGSSIKLTVRLAELCQRRGLGVFTWSGGTFEDVGGIHDDGVSGDPFQHRPCRRGMAIQSSIPRGMRVEEWAMLTVNGRRNGARAAEQ